MTNRVVKLGGILGLAGMLATPLPAAAQMFNPTTYTLSNGMQVVVVENHRAPIVTQMVWYKVGSADEVPGKSGLAHLLEHMMFKGTSAVPAGEFSKIIARAGGRDNAFTAQDYTAYYEEVAADQLELAMKLDADRMHDLSFNQHDFDTERSVVLEERRMRTDNNPGALLYERMEAALFLNSPYHRPVIGWMREIERLTRDDALAFYHRWYAPNNAILVVAGDVQPKQVEALAEKYYGPIPRADTPVRDRLKEPEQVAPRRVTLRDPRVEQPALSRLYLAPSYHYGDQDLGAADSAYAIEVLAEILGGDPTSRLYKELVVKEGLASSAGASYDPTAWDYGTFSVSATPRQGVNLDKLQAALDKVLNQALSQGISPEEVAKAKERLKASVAYAKDSVETGAHVLGEALCTGQTTADVEDWPKRIAAVTPEQVNAAAKKVLDRRWSVTGRLLPETPRPGAKPLPPIESSREIR